MNLKGIITIIGSIFLLICEIIVNAIWDFVPVNKIKIFWDLFKYKSFNIFVISVVILVAVNVCVNVLGQKKEVEHEEEKDEWDDALDETGFYKVAAEEVGVCIQNRDFESCKKIVKMVQYVRRKE